MSRNRVYVRDHYTHDNLHIVEYDDTYYINGPLIDTDGYKECMKENKYHVCFILFAAYSGIDGVRVPKEVLPITFQPIRSKANMLCNFVSDDPDARVIVLNEKSGEEFEISITNKLYIPLFMMLDHTIRANASSPIYCDFVIYRPYIARNCMLPRIQCIDGKYCMYRFKIMTIESAINEDRTNNVCCTLS